MKNLGKIILILLISINMLWSNGVTAKVNTTEVIKGDSVKLYLKAIGNSPKFPQINKIADVFIQNKSQSSSHNITMINGSINSEVSTTLILEFTPKKDMIIPSYEIEIDGKIYKTKAINIKVIKAKKLTGNEPYFLLMHTNKKTLTIGESAILTTILSISNRSGVRELANYEEPHSDYFFIKELGTMKKYIQGDNQILERRYSITAKKEANVTLTAISAKLGFPDNNNRDFFGLGLGLQWRQIHSNEVDINILAPKQESDLIGDFTLQTKIDSKEVKANKPVNLTIKIEGKGNLENFEIPKYDIDGVMVYSDEAKIDTKIVDGEVYSTYSKSFALISEHNFTIPARSFSMLSLKDKSLKSLDIPSFDIKVKEAKSSHIGIVQSNQNPKVVTKEKIVEKKVVIKSVSWWMLALAFIAGILFVLAIQAILGRKKNTNPYKESEALKILYAHISESKEIEEMVRKLYARKNGDKSVEIDKKALKEMLESFV